MSVDSYSESNEIFRDLCVTLNEGVIIPDHGRVEVFRAVERSERDDVTMFFGVDLPAVGCIITQNENIRAVVHLKQEEYGNGE